MKVKIKNTIIDSESEPILLIFKDDRDLQQTIKNLQNMLPKEGVERKYCIFPDKMSKEEITNFMKVQ